MAYVRVLFVMLLCGCSSLAREIQGPKPSRASVMVPLDGEISEDVLAPVVAKLDELVKAGDRTVLLELNSDGGDIAAGWDFIGQLRELRKRGVRVQCVVGWHAYSMAAVILEGGCDDRWAVPEAVVLFHQGSVAAEGRVADLNAAAQHLAALNHGMAVTVATRLGMPLKDYEARIELGNWSLSAADALTAGAVDAVVDGADLPPRAQLKVAPDPLAALKKLLGR